MILNEKWANSLPDDITEKYQSINDEIVSIICKRIKAIGKMSRTDVIKLTNAYEFLGADLSEIKKIIAKRTGRTEKEIESLFKDVVAEGDKYAEKFYKARGKEPITYNDDMFLKSTIYALSKQTFKTFENISNTEMIGFNVNGTYLPLKKAYTMAVDKAILEVQSGTSDYNTSMKRIVKSFGGGLRVEWDSGYHRRLDSQVRMNVLDGVRQLNQQVMDYHGSKFEADGVELSAHAISAPDHAPLQGRQFSNEEYSNVQNNRPSVDYNGVYHEAIERPIGQWNCKHFAFPIVLGISEPFYNEEQLKAFEDNSIEKYDFTQKMRKYELNLRQLKGERMALTSAGMDMEAQQVQKKINVLQKAYKDFCKEKGLTPQPKRARVSGYRRIAIDKSLR